MPKPESDDAPSTRAEWARQQFTREQWLTERLGELHDMVTKDTGFAPLRTRVTCGWPGVAPGARVECVKGVTYDASCSADGTREIFISPMLSDADEVFKVLAHEMVHALLPTSAAHGPDFLRACDRIGLTAGDAEHRLPGPALEKRMRALLARAEAYPHAKLAPPPPQPGHVIVITVNDKGEQKTTDVKPGEGGDGEPGTGVVVVASGPPAIHEKTQIVGVGDVCKLKCPYHEAIIYMRLQDAARGQPRCACGTEYEVQV